MMAQHYTLPSSVENIREAESGHFVFSGNHTNEVIGFIDYVDARDICFILFEPRDVSHLPDADVLASTLTEEQIEARLLEILDQADDDIRRNWAKLLQRTLNQN